MFSEPIACAVVDGIDLLHEHSGLDTTQPDTLEALRIYPCKTASGCICPGLVTMNAITKQISKTMGGELGFESDQSGKPFTRGCIQRREPANNKSFVRMHR